jgi:hypothetical protein
MNNSEKKQKLWAEISKNYAHLETYCEITAIGIENDSLYFHPKFTLEENVYITSQCDLRNKHIYALNIHIDNETIEMYDGLLDPIIIGYFENKDIITTALSTLKRIRKHIQNLNEFAITYIHNVLVNESITDISKSIVNELKASEMQINFIKNRKGGNNE